MLLESKEHIGKEGWELLAVTEDSVQAQTDLAPAYLPNLDTAVAFGDTPQTPRQATA